MDSHQDFVSQHTHVVAEWMKRHKEHNWEQASLADLAETCWNISREHGWTDGRMTQDPITALLLMHTEISEATELLLEADGAINKTWYEEDVQGNKKPEGFIYELADVVIRSMNLATEWNLDLTAAILEKMKYNTSRPYKHGDKKF